MNQKTVLPYTSSGTKFAASQPVANQQITMAAASENTSASTEPTKDRTLPQTPDVKDLISEPVTSNPGSLGLEERVESLLRGPIENLQVELLDVEWTGQLLRLTVDRFDTEPKSDDSESLPKRVTADQLGKINRLSSLLLEQQQTIPKGYALEVSSPGLERRLVKPKHFERAVGEKVSIKLGPASEFDRLTGRLLEIQPNDLQPERCSVTLEVDEMNGTQVEAENVTVELSDVEKASTIFDWGSVKPKNGKGKGKPGKPKSKKKKSNSKKDRGKK